jgi:hypothetical protein
MIEFSNYSKNIIFEDLDLNTLYTDSDNSVCFLAIQYGNKDVADTCLVYLFNDNTMSVVCGPDFPSEIVEDVYQLYNGQVNIYNGIVG